MTHFFCGSIGTSLLALLLVHFSVTSLSFVKNIAVTWHGPWGWVVEFPIGLVKTGDAPQGFGMFIGKIGKNNHQVFQSWMCIDIGRQIDRQINYDNLIEKSFMRSHQSICHQSEKHHLSALAHPDRRHFLLLALVVHLLIVGPLDPQGPLFEMKKFCPILSIHIWCQYVSVCVSKKASPCLLPCSRRFHPGSSQVPKSEDEDRSRALCFLGKTWKNYNLNFVAPRPLPLHAINLWICTTSKWSADPQSTSRENRTLADLRGGPKLLAVPLEPWHCDSWSMARRLHGSCLYTWCIIP